MKNTKRILGYLMTPLILCFLARTLYTTWSQVVENGFLFTFNTPLLAVSLVLLVVARGFAVEAWRRILIALGEQLGFTCGMRVWVLSNLTRYIPGNNWQVTTMIAMIQDKGVSKTNALLSQIIYTAIALSIAGLVGLSFLLDRPEIFRGGVAIAPLPFMPYVPPVGAMSCIALIAIFSTPHSYRRLIALTARITHRNLSAPDHTWARGIVPPLFSSAMWLTNGIAFYLFLTSVTAANPVPLATSIAINAGAYFIGYVSFIAPSGLGFREAALALMLGVFLPVPVAVVLALAARLWSTAGELLGVATIWSIPSHRATTSFLSVDNAAD